MRHGCAGVEILASAGVDGGGAPAVFSRRYAGLLLRIGSLLVIAALSSDAQFLPWPESEFAEAEFRWVDEKEIYPAADGPAAFALDMTVLFARGTPWSEARAMRQIRKTAQIFRACEIGLRRVRLVRMRLPKPLRSINAAAVEPHSGVPKNVRILAERLPTGVDYPVAFLIGSVAGEKSLALSYRAQQPPESAVPYLDTAYPGTAYMDTAWIAYQAHWIARNDDVYSPVAHEFAHLLCRCGHTKTAERQLLHPARNFLSSRVLPEHCERFRDSPLVSPKL